MCADALAWRLFRNPTIGRLTLKWSCDVFVKESWHLPSCDAGRKSFFYLTTLINPNSVCNINRETKPPNPLLLLLAN